MATYTHETVSLGTEYRWKVPMPAPWVEVSKASQAAASKFKEVFGRSITYDTDIEMRADDENIIIFFVDDREPGVGEC